MKRVFFRAWLFRLLLAVALAIGIGYLPYKAVGPRGVTRSLRLEEDLKKLLSENAHLAQENQALRQQISGLKKDHRVIEQVARDELGLVRPEDMVFLFE